MAESRDRSSSTEPQLKFPGCSHHRRRRLSHFRCQQCRLNEGLTPCTQESPCDVCKEWLPEAWEALEKAAQQKPKAAAAARAAKKTQEMDDSIELHAPEEGIQDPPAKHRDDGHPRRRRERSQPARLRLPRQSLPTGLPSPVTARQRLQRQSLPTGLPGPVTRRRLCHPASLWWEVPGPTAAQCLPGPTVLNTIDHAVVIGVDQVMGRRDATMPPRSSHSSRRRRSGERSRPTSSGGSSSRAKHMHWPDGCTGVWSCFGEGDGGPAFQLCHSSSSSLEVIAWSRSRSGSRHHDRRESVDSVRSGSSYVSRRDVQLSPAVPLKTNKKTIAVIPSPPRLAHMADSAGVTGPADSAEAHDSAGYESAGDLGSEVDEPEIVYDSATVADSAQHQDLAGADSARRQNPAGNDSALPQDSAGDDLARDDGPAAQGTPGLRQFIDNTLPGPLSRHRWLLMIILHLEDQDSRTPDRWPRTLVRRARGMEGWMNPEVPRVLVLPFEGPPPENLALGILLQSTFLQLWTLKTKSRTGLSRTRKMTRDLRRKSQWLSTSCFARLWRLLRARSRLTPPSLAGLPGRHWWI